jgi:hypothetical protein
MIRFGVPAGPPKLLGLGSYTGENIGSKKVIILSLLNFH